VFGCAEDNNGGYLSAVRLGWTFEIQFTYNAGSSTYPVRMDTCTASRTSQWWAEGPYGADQLQNGYSDTCLEGSETAAVPME
jgi:hypothetical protein